MEIKLPNEVLYIIGALESSGFEAYAVGGCVRDAVMGKKPQDWDICTSALPGEVKAVFKSAAPPATLGATSEDNPRSVHTIDTGLRHGTVTLVYDQRPFEITTFRVDGIYSDNRRPDQVKFVRNLEEDLSRRDFTINAMAYNPSKGLVDLFGGAADINGKIIRCVGDADTRFREDALRIMRALRFACVLGFEIDGGTAHSMHSNKALLQNIASERISMELSRLLTGQGVGSILNEFADVFCEFIPEIKDMIGFEQNNPHHHLDVWQHTIAAVSNAPPDAALRLAALLHDIVKPQCYTEQDGIGHFYGHAKEGAQMARHILRRLKYDNDTVDTVSQLVLLHDQQIEPKPRAVRRRLSRIGEMRLRQLVEIKRADAMAQPEQLRAGRLEALEEISAIIDEIIAQQQCFSLRDLAVNGRDLIDIGITEGAEIGRILHELLDMVIEEELENDRDALLKKAKELFL